MGMNNEVNSPTASEYDYTYDRYSNPYDRFCGSKEVYSARESAKQPYPSEKERLELIAWEQKEKARIKYEQAHPKRSSPVPQKQSVQKSIEKSEAKMSEPKRTISDGVIIRDLEATRIHIDEKIHDLEEVNKLWFHTISQQLRDSSKKANLNSDNSVLQEAIDLCVSISDRQEEIAKHVNGNLAKLKVDVERLAKDSYENTISNGAMRKSLNERMEKIEKRINGLYVFLGTIFIILLLMIYYY